MFKLFRNGFSGCVAFLAMIMVPLYVPLLFLGKPLICGNFFGPCENALPLWVASHLPQIGAVLAGVFCFSVLLTPVGDSHDPEAEAPKRYVARPKHLEDRWEDNSAV